MILYFPSLYFVRKVGKLSGTGEPIFNWGGLENERRRREFVGRSEGILHQKILKSRGSEIVFSAFSMTYFFKKINLGKV